MNNIADRLKVLQKNGNLRTLRADLSHKKLIDLSSNDYLGLANRQDLINKFINENCQDEVAMTSSASRLLSITQQCYINLEHFLGDLYDRDVLLFNSGYHANCGIIPALCDKNTLILCDKLVHASIIDGIILSRAKFIRFKHNDLEHLRNLIKIHHTQYHEILVVTESIFSMDGDICDIPKLVEIKKEYPEVKLYIDEAHGFGVYGKKGLGLTEHFDLINNIDVIIGTLGKAGASVGAFAVTDADVKNYLINSARSFIFSTVFPPVNCKWSQFMIEQIVDMNNERKHLHKISKLLNNFFASIGYASNSTSQIIPLIIGNSHKVLELSQHLLDIGYIALPIRTPTVPVGTERIRFSLNAGLDYETIDTLINKLKELL